MENPGKTIAKDLAAKLMTLENIKNSPLHIDDEVVVGVVTSIKYERPDIIKDGKKQKQEPYVDHFVTARVNGARAVKIPLAEVLLMQGATSLNAESDYVIADKFKVTASTPRVKNGQILFPLNYAPGYADFIKNLQNNGGFTAEVVQKFRADIAALGLSEDKAIQDYVVETLS